MSESPSIVAGSAVFKTPSRIPQPGSGGGGPNTLPRKGILKRPGTLGGSVRRVSDNKDDLSPSADSRVRRTGGSQSAEGLTSPSGQETQIDNERSDRLTPLRDSVSHAGSGVGYFVPSSVAGSRPNSSATAEWIKNTQLNSLVARQQQHSSTSSLAGGARKLYKHRSHSIESDSEHHLHYTGNNQAAATLDKPTVKVKYSSSLRETSNRSSELSSDGSQRRSSLEQGSKIPKLSVTWWETSSVTGEAPVSQRRGSVENRNAVTTPISTPRPRGSSEPPPSDECEDDDTGSLHSCDSAATGTSVGNHSTISQNWPGKSTRYVLHCDKRHMHDHNDHNGDYLTPTQRKNKMIVELRKQIKHLEKLLAEKEQHVEQLRDRLNELENVMNQGGCLTENHRLKTKVKQLEDQLKAETESITDRYETELKKLRRRLKSTDGESDSVKSGESGTVDKMKSEFDALKQECEAYKYESLMLKQKVSELESGLSKYDAGSAATSCTNRNCIDRAKDISAQLEAYRLEAVNWRNKASEMEVQHKQHLENCSVSSSELLSPPNGAATPVNSPLSPNSEELENMSEGQKELLIEKLRHRIERLERKLQHERQGDRAARKERKMRLSPKQTASESEECHSPNCLIQLEEMRRRSGTVQLDNQKLSEANENVAVEIEELRKQLDLRCEQLETCYGRMQSLEKDLTLNKTQLEVSNLTIERMRETNNSQAMSIRSLEEQLQKYEGNMTPDGIPIPRRKMSRFVVETINKVTQSDLTMEHVDQTEEELKDLKDRYSNLNDKTKSEMEDLQGRLNETVTNLNLKNSVVSTLGNQLTALQTDFETSMTNWDKERNELHTKLSEQTLIAQRVPFLESEVLSAKQDLIEMENRLTEQSAKFDSCLEDSLAGSMQSQANTADYWKEKLSKSESNLAKATKRCEKLTSELQDIKMRLNLEKVQLQQKLSETGVEMEKLNAKVYASKDHKEVQAYPVTLDKYVACSVRTVDRITEVLEGDLIDEKDLQLQLLQGELTTTRRQVEILQGKLLVSETTSQSHDEVELKNRELQSRLNLIETSLEDVRSQRLLESAEMQRDIQRLEQEKEELKLMKKQKLNQIESEFAILQKELETVVRSHETERNSLKRRVAKLEKLNGELEKRLALTTVGVPQKQEDKQPVLSEESDLSSPLGSLHFASDNVTADDFSEWSSLEKTIEEITEFTQDRGVPEAANLNDFQPTDATTSSTQVAVEPESQKDSWTGSETLVRLKEALAEIDSLEGGSMETIVSLQDEFSCQATPQILVDKDGSSSSQSLDNDQFSPQKDIRVALKVQRQTSNTLTRTVQHQSELMEKLQAQLEQLQAEKVQLESALSRKETSSAGGDNNMATLSAPGSPPDVMKDSGISYRSLSPPETRKAMEDAVATTSDSEHTAALIHKLKADKVRLEHQNGELLKQLRLVHENFAAVVSKFSEKNEVEETTIERNEDDKMLNTWLETNLVKEKEEISEVSNWYETDKRLLESCVDQIKEEREELTLKNFRLQQDLNRVTDELVSLQNLHRELCHELELYKAEDYASTRMAVDQTDGSDNVGGRFPSKSEPNLSSCPTAAESSVEMWREKAGHLFKEAVLLEKHFRAAKYAKTEVEEELEALKGEIEMSRAKFLTERDKFINRIEELTGEPWSTDEFDSSEAEDSWLKTVKTSKVMMARELLQLREMVARRDQEKELMEQRLRGEVLKLQEQLFIEKARWSSCSSQLNLLQMELASGPEDGSSDENFTLRKLLEIRTAELKEMAGEMEKQRAEADSRLNNAQTKLRSITNILNEKETCIRILEHEIKSYESGLKHQREAYGEQIEQMCEKIERLEAGDQLPIITITEASGESRSLPKDPAFALEAAEIERIWKTELRATKERHRAEMSEFKRTLASEKGQLESRAKTLHEKFTTLRNILTEKENCIRILERELKSTEDGLLAQRLKFETDVNCLRSKLLILQESGNESTLSVALDDLELRHKEDKSRYEEQIVWLDQKISSLQEQLNQARDQPVATPIETVTAVIHSSAVEHSDLLDKLVVYEETISSLEKDLSMSRELITSLRAENRNLMVDDRASFKMAMMEDNCVAIDSDFDSLPSVPECPTPKSCPTPPDQPASTAATFTFSCGEIVETVTYEAQMESKMTITVAGSDASASTSEGMRKTVERQLPIDDSMMRSAEFPDRTLVHKSQSHADIQTSSVITTDAATDAIPPPAPQWDSMRGGLELLQAELQCQQRKFKQQLEDVEDKLIAATKENQMLIHEVEMSKRNYESDKKRLEALNAELQRKLQETIMSMEPNPAFENAFEKARTLEAAVETLTKEMTERQEKEKEMYLLMFRKGQDAARNDDFQELPGVHKSVSQDAKDGGKKMVAGAAAKGKGGLTDEEILLRFVRDALYYYILEKDAKDHLHVLMNILKFSEKQRQEILKTKGVS